MGISKNYEEGSHWKKQEEKLKANMEKELAAEKERAAPERSGSEISREL